MARLLSSLLFAVLIAFVVAVTPAGGEDGSSSYDTAGFNYDGVANNVQNAVPATDASGATTSDPAGKSGTAPLAAEPRSEQSQSHVAPRVTTGLTRNADGLFGSNVTQLRTPTSGGFVRDAGGPVQVFQSEVAGGGAAAQQFFQAQVGRAPNAALATDVAEAGGLRYTIRGSSHGAPTVEVFDVGAATVEKIRFLE